MTKWLNDLEQRLWRAWLTAHADLLDAIDQDLQPKGVDHADYEILAHLSEAPECAMRMSDLAETILVTRSGLTYRISTLESRGLVKRASAGDDGRGVAAVLTAKGQRLIKQLAPGHVETVRDALIDHLRPETKKLLAEDLAALLASRQGGTVRPHSSR